MVSSILGKSRSLVGSCQDCTVGGEARAIHTFPKFLILYLKHEAARYRAKWGHWLWTWQTFLANLWMQNILQKLSVVCRHYSGPWRHFVCCYHSILVISHNHYKLNFRLLAATFFQVRRSCMLPIKGVRFLLWFKISYLCFIYGNNSVQKLLTFCLVAPRQFFCDPLVSCSVPCSADVELTLQWLFCSAVFESQLWKQKRMTCLFHAQFLHMIWVNLLPTECWQ